MLISVVFLMVPSSESISVLRSLRLSFGERSRSVRAACALAPQLPFTSQFRVILGCLKWSRLAGWEVLVLLPSRNRERGRRVGMQAAMIAILSSRLGYH